MNDTLVVAKGFLKSKTVWLGVLNAAVALFEILTTEPLLERYWPTLLAINGVVIVILRAFTKQPLATSPLENSIRSVSLPKLPPLK